MSKHSTFTAEDKVWVIFKDVLTDTWKIAPRRSFNPVLDRPVDTFMWFVDALTEIELRNWYYVSYKSFATRYYALEVA